MKSGILLRRGFAALALLAVCTVAQAQSGAWKYSLTPYFWLPNVNGTLKYSLPPGAAGSPGVETGPNDYLENLSGVLMLAGEARNGPWAVFSDLIYLKFDSEESSVRTVDFVNVGSNPINTSLNVGTTTELKGWAWTLGASRTLVSSPQGNLDVLAGLRYLDIDATTDWRLSAAINGPGGSVFPATGRVAAGTTIWDGIIGLRGRAQLGTSKWSVPFYFDIGAGESQLTWQGLAGIAYSFGWGEVTLAYRHLYYDQDDDKLMQDFEFSGPALGATFRF
jgi:hypothetical protein